MFYTGVKSVVREESTLSDAIHNSRETQCLAFSQDSDLRTWTKVARPVVAAPPPGMAVVGFPESLCVARA